MVNYLPEGYDTKRRTLEEVRDEGKNPNLLRGGIRFKPEMLGRDTPIRYTQYAGTRDVASWDGKLSDSQIARMARLDYMSRIERDEEVRLQKLRELAKEFSTGGTMTMKPPKKGRKKDGKPDPQRDIDLKRRAKLKKIWGET